MALHSAGGVKAVLLPGRRGLPAEVGLLSTSLLHRHTQIDVLAADFHAGSMCANACVSVCMSVSMSVHTCAHVWVCARACEHSTCVHTCE